MTDWTLHRQPKDQIVDHEFSIWCDEQPVVLANIMPGEDGVLATIVHRLNGYDALVEALTEAAERLEARGHNFGAREARKALDAVLPTAEDVRGILAPVGSAGKP